MKPEILKQKLQKLDFSAYDADVYLALIEHGPCNAGPIIKDTRLHRNIVYTSLDHLIGRKLATEKIVKGRKRFTATTPGELSSEYETKAQTANLVTEELEGLIKQPIQEITVYQGNEEFLSLLTGIIKKMPLESTKYVLGTGGKAFMDNTMTPIWKPYHKVARSRKLKIRMLSYEDQKKAIATPTHDVNMYETRYLPSNIENPSGIHIYPELGIVLNIIYSDNDNPVTAIKIKNPALVQGYLNLFENLWATGKE